MSERPKPRTEDMWQLSELPIRLLEQAIESTAHTLHRDVLRQLSDDETVESTIEEGYTLPEAREESAQ